MLLDLPKPGFPLRDDIGRRHTDNWTYCSVRLAVTSPSTNGPKARSKEIHRRWLRIGLKLKPNKRLEGDLVDGSGKTGNPSPFILPANHTLYLIRDLKLQSIS